jgi:hypothetical protein
VKLPGWCLEYGDDADLCPAPASGLRAMRRESSELLGEVFFSLSKGRRSVSMSEIDKVDLLDGSATLADVLEQYRALPHLCYRVGTA